MTKISGKPLRWILFDIDGVLIDVSHSFDLAVRETFKRLFDERGAEKNVDLEDIRTLRRKGSLGDDFKLTEALFFLKRSEDLSVEDFPEGESLDWCKGGSKRGPDPSKIETIFDDLYLGGEEGKGLWKKEKPLPGAEKLKKLEKKYSLGAITGRSREELDLAEKILDYEFSRFVTRDDFLKPDPKALKKLIGKQRGLYVGDAKVDEKLVINHRENGGNCSFLMVDRDVKNLEKVMDRLLEVST